MHDLSHRRGLRLVPQAETGRVESKNVQLSLDFPESPEIILLLESKLQEHGFFSALVERFKPCYLFDTRVAPRLDFIASTRPQAFQRLHEFNLKYVDLHGAIEHKDPELEHSGDWLNLAIDAVEKARCSHGPYLFIFDSDSTLKESRRSIPQKFKEAGKLKSETALLGQEIEL